MKYLVSLLTSTAMFPIAFANANAGSELYVCATAQQSDLDRADYEGLAWVQVKAVGSHGEVGSTTNILTYDTWDTVVIQKAKGMTDAGSPEIELARIPNDPGQEILRTAARTNLNYAFKIVRNDEVSATASPTVIYNRGLVTGPRRPMGRNEDFDLEIFTLALNQEEVIVDAGAGGVAPSNTAVPTITQADPTTNPDPAVGELLTASTGTFTGDPTITYAYRWFAGGVAISGATGSTFTPTSAQVGKTITVRVTATNDSGQAIAFSAPTTPVEA